MAEVDSGGGGGHGKKGGPKTKKKSTRIDMTAMVDVAFLLLTFFVLTATMSNSAVMDLTMPPKVTDETPEDQTKADVEETKILTIILDENDMVRTYWKVTDPVVDSTDYAGLHDKLAAHINRKANRCPKGTKAEDIKASQCWDPIFVIKPRKKSRYKNLIDVLDELAVVGATKYAITDFGETDSLILAGTYEYDAKK